jgi:hypothetical protein
MNFNRKIFDVVEKFGMKEIISLWRDKFKTK